MADLSLEMVLAATNGRLLGEKPVSALRGVSTDTRTLVAGSLFVALKGERFDAHEFVGEAFKRGAAAALVSREVNAKPLIVVEDTLTALGALAAAHRKTLSPTVISITGSTGKTTTKEMIAGILSQGWKTARTPGNYNNEIGVPLALLELDATHQAAVVELAMRGVGQIAYLARMAQPQIGVITNIGMSHLELLGSKQAIAETKAELLASLPETGTAVLNAEDEFFNFLSKRSPGRVVSFGKTETADVRADRISVRNDGTIEFFLRGWWGEQRIALKAAGRHHALNAAAAAAAAMSAGANAAWIAPGLEAFEGAEMRSRVVRTPSGITVIDDCYNAAPDSMRVAMELLADLPGRDKWAVLGDMKELGPLSPEWHQEVGELAGDLGLAGVITLGELGHFIAKGAQADLPAEKVLEASDNAEAAQMVADLLAAGDVVLVKGSRAMKMEEIVERLLRPETWRNERDDE